MKNVEYMIKAKLFYTNMYSEEFDRVQVHLTNMLSGR